MEYKKIEISSLHDAKPIESKKVTFIWASDGWCYIPQLKLRQKFTEKRYCHEDWQGVIPMPEYIEQVNWTLYSKEPRIWQENEDVFSQRGTSQQENKPKNPLLILRRQLQQA